MANNGDGETHDHGAGEHQVGRTATREEYLAARAAFGEPCDRVDRLALFTIEQCDSLLQGFKSQFETMFGVIKALAGRVALLEVEIGALKAAQRDGEGETLQ